MPKTITEDWLSERIDIRLEHIPRPTAKQEHDALNATLKDLREIYGEIEVVRWPKSSGRQTPTS